MGSPFPQTRWSVVARAAGNDQERARRAITELCRAYWQPLYAYARGDHMRPEDAEDAVQGFLGEVLCMGALTPDPQRGRFRSYLLGAFRHHLANSRVRHNALKRGGGATHIPLDAVVDRDEGERCCGGWLERAKTPEEVYAQQWARSVIARVEAALREDYVRRGKEALFAALAGCLSGETDQPYREIAQGLGLREGAVKVAVFRLRKRFGTLLRQEIADTVADPQDVDAELRDLLRAVRADLL